MIQSVLNWRTSLVALFIFVLPVLVGFKVISREIAEASIIILAGIGFLNAKDAQELKGKIPPKTGIWLLLFAPLLLTNCTALKQVDYNQVAKSFSQKAIRQIFESPNFNFDSDSIELKKVVSYELITEVLGTKLASKFTAKGETTLTTLSVHIRIEWHYNKGNTVYLTFKRIRKNGKSYAMGRNIRRVGARHNYRLCRQDLV